MDSLIVSLTMLIAVIIYAISMFYAYKHGRQAGAMLFQDHAAKLEKRNEHLKEALDQKQAEMEYEALFRTTDGKFFTNKHFEDEDV